MEFSTSKSDAYAVLYCTLVFFLILAVASTGWLNKFLPESLVNILVLKPNGGGGEDGEEEKQAISGADHFLSARSSSSAIAVALSFFASGMGAWVVYGSTEMGK